MTVGLLKTRRDADCGGHGVVYLQCEGQRYIQNRKINNDTRVKTKDKVKLNDL